MNVGIKFWKKAPGAGNAKICPECGTNIEEDAKFCTQCAAAVAPEAVASPPATKAAPAAIRGSRNVEPWAAKAGESVSKLPRGVKIGIPIVIFLLMAVVVALFVLVATHSPQAAVSRYLGSLKVGDYETAYKLVSHPGDKFSTYEYFRKWQNTQADAIGRLQEFRVQPRKDKNKLFERLLSTTPTTGARFVVTMKYKNKSFDINMAADSAGGAWPFRKWRLNLSEGISRLVVEPLGAQVYIDGTYVGNAEEDKDLKEALELKRFPKDIDDAIEYARKFLRAIQYLTSDSKRLAACLDDVAESAQSATDRFGRSGSSGDEFLNAVDRIMQQSKDVGGELSRIAMRLYWILGGGDDGSLRAKLTRVQSGIDVSDLPEGFHTVTVALPGLNSETKKWIAPQSVELALEATAATMDSLENVTNGYLKERSNAGRSLNPAGLKTFLAGDLLKTETDRVRDLIGRAECVRSQLTALKYGKIKMLSEGVATVETHETWNFLTYKGAALVSTLTDQKIEMVYTLEEQGGGLWKVTESKKLSDD